MAFWLVYQGNSWRRSRAGGYMWAPTVNRAGRAQSYWDNMKRVEPGDFIFSGVDGAIRAVSQPNARAYDAKRPDPLDEQHWEQDGWRLDVAYTDFPRPLFYGDWVPTVQTELRYSHSPFTETGRPNQGYLYELPDAVGEFLIGLARRDGAEVDLEAVKAAPAPPEQETSRATIIQARVGQGAFRSELMKRWNGRCPLSGVDRPELLRASHIKPWSSSNNKERLDPNNGLLLSAAYDAAFDGRLITFGVKGQMVLAQDFTPQAAAAAGLDPTKVLPLAAEMQPYLAAHRKLVAARLA